MTLAMQGVQLAHSGAGEFPIGQCHSGHHHLPLSRATQLGTVGPVVLQPSKRMTLVCFATLHLDRWFGYFLQEFACDSISEPVFHLEGVGHH